MPDVLVNLSINLELPRFLPLNAVDGFVELEEEGYRGIIIYRHSWDVFTAFDRACPYHPSQEGCLVEAQPPLAYDACCGSRFLLFDGSVVTGPARWPLKQYQVFYNYPNLFISN